MHTFFLLKKSGGTKFHRDGQGVSGTCFSYFQSKAKGGACQYKSPRRSAQKTGRNFYGKRLQGGAHSLSPLKLSLKLRKDNPLRGQPAPPLLNRPLLTAALEAGVLPYLAPHPPSPAILQPAKPARRAPLYV
ncbi:hypothetical protein HMPREF0262_02560 [Clostridium sp. ATCC 29733]|nr:hypothetical protein HMPREF0262_02560 [Clostridium sp. ATCC 29733]